MVHIDSPMCVINSLINRIWHSFQEATGYHHLYPVIFVKTKGIRVLLRLAEPHPAPTTKTITKKTNKNRPLASLKKQFSNNPSSNRVKVALIKALNHWLLQQNSLGIN